MEHNPVIDCLLNHKSIRKYTDEVPSVELINNIVRAGQQAPFASQLYSILLSKDDREHHPWKAPLSFIICLDFHKLELFMKKRGWERTTNDLLLLLLGLQDATYVTQNMIVAGESVGLGSCLLGFTPYAADRIAEKFSLPQGVFPLVELVMGYPAEDPPTRPRFPLDFVLFEGRYPEFTEEQIDEAMQVMDDGYLAQDYYKGANVKIPILHNRKEETFTFDNYSWTEHISRKWGQWKEHPQGLADLLEQFKKRGFKITLDEEN